MPNHFYPALGKCMYCGTTQLPAGTRRFTDEHIIPLALGGSLVLRESSCDACAKIINQEIETPVLFKEWKLRRIKSGFPSRNKNSKKKALKTRVFLTRRDGRSLEISVMDYTCPVPLYKFREARIFTGEARGDDNMRWTMDILASNDEETAMQRKFPEWNFRHAIFPRPYEFARLLSKIAYSYAVAEYGLDGFAPLAPAIILGHSDDYFFTVGGGFEAQEPIPGGDHITDIKMIFKGPQLAILFVEIRLFSQIKTPRYRVAVGIIDLGNSQHLTTFERHRQNKTMVVAPA